eukprot:CAMPEP_0178623374 /NCGR_PEP_ID=MMETSP0698-20121128/6806_1 /TAXON_ID=265572 /ORGANISM="Extubocellulus spinifer, Strain CCMP396" /LENGTH=60 /DNA_ID=CAMNT_0020262457 /DNA_START=41 /DNA_END=223 /DNA_ORIENTATION=+
MRKPIGHIGGGRELRRARTRPPRTLDWANNMDAGTKYFVTKRSSIEQHGHERCGKERQGA